MSEQIREQISAFLDGELPSAESELLLKRMVRDAALRDSFGRYALIGEAMRGMKHVPLRGNFTGAINGVIDGEPATAVAIALAAAGPRRWWRPLAGAAIAASVALVAIVALQWRTGVSPIVALVPRASTAVTAPLVAKNHEAISYITPPSNGSSPNAIPGARLTKYVFAHSQYPSLLGQRDVMTDLIVDVDQPTPEADASPAR
jgi:negative regulator of sigma E activity